MRQKHNLRDAMISILLLVFALAVTPEQKSALLVCVGSVCQQITNLVRILAFALQTPRGLVPTTRLMAATQASTVTELRLLSSTPQCRLRLRICLRNMAFSQI